MPTKSKSKAKLEPVVDDTNTSVAIAMIYMAARDIAVEVFQYSEGEIPSMEVTNGVFDRCIYLDEDTGEMIEESIAEAQQELVEARVWAKEVYNSDSPEATFEAFDRAFDLDDDDDEP